MREFPLPSASDVLCSRVYSGLLQQYGIRVFMIGRKDLLPPDVQLACSNIEQATAKNTRYVNHNKLFISLT